MISFLSGKIINLNSSIIEILPNAGIGYEVHINEIISAKLLNEVEVGLYIHHHITEGGQSLFGFIEKDERDIFRELIKISGVGGKVAMLILSLGKGALSEAIINEDKKMIESIKGIGKKMAEKIILELKDKDFIKFNYSYINTKNNETKVSSIDSDLKSNIVDTLVNMGYNSKSVLKELENIPKDMKEAGEIIPFLIKNL